MIALAFTLVFQRRFFAHFAELALIPFAGSSVRNLLSKVISEIYELVEISIFYNLYYVRNFFSLWATEDLLMLGAGKMPECPWKVRFQFAWAFLRALLVGAIMICSCTLLG